MKIKTIFTLAAIGFIAYKVLTSKPVKLYVGALVIDAGADILKKRLSR